MTTPSSRPGFDPAPRRVDRLFLAIFPDGGTASHIECLARTLKAAHGLKGKPQEAPRLHVTLHHLGDHAGLPSQIVRQAHAAAAVAAAAAAPFEVCFDRAMSFDRPRNRPRNRPFVLRGAAGLAELRAFRQSLGQALAAQGLEARADACFTPHVTLLYDDRSVDETPIAPIRWTAHELVLVHSLIGQHVHLALARWTLGA